MNRINEKDIWNWYNLGFKIFPVRKDSKQPNINSWVPYQEKQPSRKEVEKWIKDELFENIGCACGFVSKGKFLVVIDLDSKEAVEIFAADIKELMKNTLVVRSGGTGTRYHVYFYTDIPPEHPEHPNQPKMDILTIGSYVLLPPSIHPETEREYEIVSSVKEPHFTRDLKSKINLIKERAGIKKTKRSMKEVSKGYKKGTREVEAFNHACYLLNIVELSPETVWSELHRVNKETKPPLGEEELEHAFHSAMQYYGLEKESMNPEIIEGAEKLLNGDIWKTLLDSTGRRVVRDVVYRKMIFLNAISSLTSKPFNLAVLGRTSIGKTFVASVVSYYIPDKYLVSLGGMSPSAFIHEHGDFDEVKREVKIDFDKKTLLFLDTPMFETLEKLKPLLSHDKKEIIFKIADKTKSGQIRTKTVRIHGQPACLLCSAAAILKTEEQKTRWITMTPEISKEKTRESIEIMADKFAGKIDIVEEEKEIKMFHAAYEILAEMAPIKVVVPYSKILSKAFVPADPSAMRLFNWLGNLIVAHAALHCFQRDKNSKGEIMANSKDLEEVLELLKSFSIPTIMGMSGDAWLLYISIKNEKKKEFSTEDIVHYTRDLLGQLDEQTIRVNYIRELVNKGLLIEETDPVDKRKNLYHAGEVPKTQFFVNEQEIIKNVKKFASL